MTEKSNVEKRMMNMKNFYIKAGEFIDNLPDSIPEKTRDMIKDTVLGDKELKKLMEGVDSHRPPRIFLIGRTGVGKSSLINAICGSYVANVGDVRSCTSNASIYEVRDGDRVLMEILDTRGIAESESLDNFSTAEDMLIDHISEFSPDVAIMMLNSTHRDDVKSDAEFLKKVSSEYEKVNNVRLPIVVVVNKCDEMPPTRHKDPAKYTPTKIKKINEVVMYYKEIIVKNGLKIDNIIAVSSLIEWQTPDGLEFDVEDIDNLPKYDIDNLEIAFDGRYNIEELIDILVEAILDFEAQMGLRMASRLNEVAKRMSKHLIKIFSIMSSTVALSPLPMSDIYILLIIQTILVALIAALGGRDISMDAAKEFIFGMGGLTAAGFTFRTIAQQSAKLLNFIVPTSGSAVSSIVAGTGTMLIGNAAVSYYIDGVTIDDVKNNFENDKKKKE